MPANYVLLEKITVGAAGASSISFTNIPQTYTDLQIILSVRASAGAVVTSYINTINGAGYTGLQRFLNTDGGTVYSGTTYPYAVGGSSYTGNAFTSIQFYIPNYTSSNFKSISVESVAENNGTGTAMFLTSVLAQVTSAINAISFSCDNSFVQHTTAYLYGVAKSGVNPTIAPQAIGGDTIGTDGTYWYHAFKASGTFTPINPLSCDVLVVAGGGAGGGSVQYWGGGGGGAGGVLAHSAQSLAATNYLVTIGAGGAGGTTTDVDGMSSGNSSQFGSLTASLFGGLGGNINGPGGIGPCGSSGGNLGNYTTGWWVPTTGQGFRGGYNTVSSQTAGGGGGAGAIGSNATGNPNGGAGGAGVNTYTNWGSLSAALTATGTGVSGYIAGGGGGGGSPAYGTVTSAPGGSGGGGNGGTISSTGVTSGVANTGSGGGGGAGTNATSPPNGIGGNGGSGLVIVRYRV